MVIQELFLVLAYAPLDLVDEGVYRGVHILVDGFGIYLLAVDLHRGFGFVAQFLDGQNTMDIRYQVKVPADSLEPGIDVRSHGLSNFDVVA